MVSVQEMKLALRLTSAALDPEIEATMAAATLDLESGGMPAQSDSALVDMAVKLYCKWQFDYMGKADQYQRSYEQLKSVLALLPKEVDDGA